MDNQLEKAYIENAFEECYVFNEQKFYLDYARFLLNKLMDRLKG
jgi:hypothetical protein